MGGREAALFDDIRRLVDGARASVSQTVNHALVMMYWGIGERILSEVLGKERAAYGERIVERLSARLTEIYGSGFSRRSLFEMIQFAEAFPDVEIVRALSAQLSWTHFRRLLAIDNQLHRDFYAELCRVERWSTRTLKTKIDSMLFERTALSRKPEELAIQDLAQLRDDDRMSPDLVFRDPYFLTFLGLADTSSERDLETAILRELEAFLPEIGTDFAFVARQKRITVDARDYFIDLLFYHRRLRRLVAIELKLGDFQAADKGQLELYLRWLAKNERRPEEDTPLGLILCAGKSDEHVELLELKSAGIRIAQYMIELPDEATLRAQLHRAIERARAQLASRAGGEAPEGDKAKR
ncbi:MAG: PDDEXK nuclease domain-containing protein [Deltaproteobacteria bacterium]|nr:PDDEXK nuclease domain-containing protein [Deltaproteobacteria bacterium]